MNTLKMTVVALLVLQCTWVAQSQAQGRSEQVLAELETKPHMPGEVLIQYRHGTTKEQKAAILSNAIPTASLARKCMTGGRLNVSGF
jgi:hypothetical protein